MPNINCTICVEFSSVTGDLILLVLRFENLVIGEDHSIDAVADVGTLSELTEPFRTLLIDHLFKLEVCAVEVERLLNVIKVILDRKRP